MTERQSLSVMRRLRIFEAHGGVCYLCGLRIQAGEKWDVEHRRALGLLGADDESNMAPAHKACHSEKTAVDVTTIARAKRRKAKHIGIKKPPAFPCGRDSRWKKKLNGQVVLR